MAKEPTPPLRKPEPLIEDVSPKPPSAVKPPPPPPPPPKKKD